MLTKMTVEAFVEELASSSPAPGGGSVSALNGSLAAGLLSMVAKLTIGKKGYEEVTEDMKRLEEKATGYKTELTKLVDEDTEAFNQVMAAFKMPKDTDEQVAKRKEAIQEAYKAAVRVPLRVAEVCYEVLKMCPEAAAKGNKNAASDIGVAACAAWCGLEGALLNVKINLPGIKDEAFVKDVESKISDMPASGGKYRDEVLAEVKKSL